MTLCLWLWLWSNDLILYMYNLHENMKRHLKQVSAACFWEFILMSLQRHMLDIKDNYEQPSKNNDSIHKYTKVRQNTGYRWQIQIAVTEQNIKYQILNTHVRQTTRYRWQIQIAVTEQWDNRKPTLAWPQEHQGQQIADNVSL